MFSNSSVHINKKFLWMIKKIKELERINKKLLVENRLFRKKLNLKKIKQEELFSKDMLTVSYDTSMHKIKDEIPVII